MGATKPNQLTRTISDLLRAMERTQGLIDTAEKLVAEAIQLRKNALMVRREAATTRQRTGSDSAPRMAGYRSRPR
jgi:hypothetical protein